MTKILKSIRKLENTFDKKMERFSFHHPYFACFAMFIGLPILILAVVCIGTAIISFPIVWLMGWL